MGFDRAAFLTALYESREDGWPECDHTLTNTVRVLQAVTADANEQFAAIEWLRANGGYCDCEVILNVVLATQGSER